VIGIICSAIILPATWITLTARTPSQSQGQPTMLPPAAGGWIRTDSVGVYAGKNLFLLVDGGADLFFEYGFVRALSSEYSHFPEATVATELYEMKSPSAAYGLFTSFTAGTGTAVPIGQEAVLGEGYCIFWKGPYVGMLTVAAVDSMSGRMLLQLAGELEKQIDHTGPLPDLCTILREGGIESRTMVYISGKLALGNHFHHAWAEPLPPTNGVVGESRGSRYLILEYTDDAAADTALRAAAVEWEKLQFPVVRDSGGKWTFQPHEQGVAMVEQKGRYILAVSGDKEQSEVLGSILRRILGG
jgi:Family of unknown function (DUF6599)